ncbi:RNA pyrophosphohydrolase [uncultured archaeon]|nr:RNA pyrophosphohydrolase [uncultured archaeon]
MRFRKAIFALTYSRNKNKIEYLILKRKKHWIGWEFPKGGIEFLETKKMAVRREIKEETGLKILNIKKFNVAGLYKYKKKFPDRKGVVGQKYSLYAVRVKKGNVKIDSREHSGYKWMNFNEAMKKLTWKNQKKCLKIVNNWLKYEI